MLQTVPLQLGIPGGPELLIILLIAVLLFGANKIPKLARSTGEAMGEFQKGREEVEQELEEIRDGATASDSTSTSSTETATAADDSEAGSTDSEEADSEQTDTDAEDEETVDKDLIGDAEETSR